MPAAVVCLPTYNERENLEPMLRALGDKGARVLVIDDSSPDGTGELADRLAEELDYVPMPDPVVRLIQTSWKSQLKDSSGNPVY